MALILRLKNFGARMGKTARAMASRYEEPTAAEEQPFFDEIIAAPDDDTPRLILADWLEERGDPRSEFIRVQCQLAKLNGDEAEYDALEDHESELLTTHRTRWLKRQLNLPGIGYGVAAYLRDFSLCQWDNERSFFERGMIELATPKSYADLRKQAGVMFEMTLVRELRLARLSLKQFSELLASDIGRRLTGLVAPGSELGPEEASALADSPIVCALRTLTLSECRIGNEGLAALLPKLARVRRLGISDCRFTADSATLLANWKGLRQVQALNFDLDRSNESLEIFAASPNLGGLRSLRVGNHVNDWILNTLVGAKALRQLRGLCLACATLTQQSLAQLPTFAKLRRLSLYESKIDDQAASTLGRVSTLRCLDLRRTRLSRECVARLRKALPGCTIMAGSR